MARAFQYKPKFVDIRVRPPKPGEDEAAQPDVFDLKPGQVRCEHEGCLAVATARAPKSRTVLNEFYQFCQPHAAEYNKSWNFFAGMSEEEQTQYRADAATGHRPTWTFKASRLSREAASFAAKFGSGAAGKGAGAYADAFGMFGGPNAARPKAPAGRTLGRLESRALAELDLEMDADRAAIRTRYLDLVKRFHPDSNGGDRSTETKLQRVIRAYKTLVAAKLA